MHATFLRLSALALALSVCSVLVPATSAHAQAATPVTVKPSPIEADIKGMVGVGLIGAELGLVLPAVAGLHEVWSLIVFPVVGGGAGAAIGYFAIEKGNHAELAVASLTLGMGLVIPAILITASAAAYDPNEDMADADAVHLAKVEAAAERARDPELAGSGLVRVAEGGVAVAAPAMLVLPATNDGALELSEVQLSVLSGRF